MFAAPETNFQITLNGSADWAFWNREFLAKMKALNLLDYFEGKEDLVEKPPKPFNSIQAAEDQINKELQDLIVQLKASSSPTAIGHNAPDLAGRQQQEGEAPTEPSTTTSSTAAPADDKPLPPGYSDLTAAQRKIYDEKKKWFQDHFSLIAADAARNYDNQRRDWESQDSRLCQAGAFLMTTVAPHLRQAHFSATGDFRVWYNNLKQAQNIFAVAQAVKTRLRDHFGAFEALEHKNMSWADFEQWLTTWETLIDAASLQRLVEATPGVWFANLMNALSKPFPYFVSLYRVSKHHDLANLTFQSVATDVRRGAQVYLAAAPDRVGKDSEQFEEQDDRPSGQSGRGRESEPRRDISQPKRKLSPATRQGQCRACEHSHLTERCYYLRPELAPKDWKSREHVWARVEANLMADSSLRAEANRIRSKRFRNSLTESTVKTE